MKTTSRFWAAIAVSAGLLASCADIEEINNRLDEFDGRITALETVTTNLNKNVEALQTLYGGATINSASNSNGTWTVVLSNGETLTLTQGSIGVGNAPVMSVDADGYWMVDYDGDGGNAPSHIKNGEDKVLAVGTNGKTPIFGVDAEGYWTVKYEETETPAQILGADGKPVKALPEGGVQDPYFADVKVENGQFKVTLRSGEELVIPVVSDFLCAIESTGVQTFNAGETKPFNVSIKGVKSTMISAPAGWSATLSEPADEKAVLTVTAPAATKSVIADSRSDISILAFSDQGFATIAKISVNCSDTPVVHNPVAAVTAGTATETTLAYSVAVSDVTSWKYIHQKESETAPDAAKIAADGIAGTETALTFENLDPETAYVLYVLPVHSDKQGTVASAKNTTLKQLIASYYALYNAGETITIDGKQISKELNGDATLMESDGNITTNGVYFLKEGVTATYTGTGAIKKFIVIGDKEGTRSTFNAPVSQTGENKYMKLNGNGDGTGYVIFHNVIFDQTATSTQYAITVNYNESFPLVMFSNCQIKQNSAKPIFYISSASRSITDLRFVDCDCNVTAQSAFVSSGSSSTATYGTFTVKNCVFYGDGSTKFILHEGAKATYESIVFENNTFVNIVGKERALFYPATINNATIRKNIFSNSGLAENQAVLRYTNGPSAASISDNICYTGGETKYKAFYGKNVTEDMGSDIELLGSDPFTGGTFDLANGTFTPAAAYASYGAQR